MTAIFIHFTVMLNWDIYTWMNPTRAEHLFVIWSNSRTNKSQRIVSFFCWPIQECSFVADLLTVHVDFCRCAVFHCYCSFFITSSFKETIFTLTVVFSAYFVGLFRNSLRNRLLPESIYDLICSHFYIGKPYKIILMEYICIYGSVLVPPLFVLYRNFATSNIASFHCFLAYFGLHLLTYFVELP